MRQKPSASLRLLWATGLCLALLSPACTVYGKYGVRVANSTEGAQLGVQLPDIPLAPCGLKADANDCIYSLPPDTCPDGLSQVRWTRTSKKSAVMQVWCVASMLPPAPTTDPPGPGDL